MWRWLLLPLGLAAVGLAAWLLLARPPDGTPGVAARDAAGRAPPPADADDRSGAGLPLGEIDAASRRRLERVLDEEGAAP